MQIVSGDKLTVMVAGGGEAVGKDYDIVAGFLEPGRRLYHLPRTYFTHQVAW